jgi:hypothetical protein
MFLSERLAQLNLQAPGSLFVVFYDSQGYGGGIPTSLHRGLLPDTKDKYYASGGRNYKRLNSVQLKFKLCNSRFPPEGLYLYLQ